MDDFYNDLKDFFRNAGIGIAVVMGIMYLVMLFMVLLASSCGVNRISYKQTETRFMQKTDSLNFKVEPSEVIDHGRYN